MAYKIDKNGMLVGDGLPDGVALNADQYSKIVADYNKKDMATSMFGIMGPNPEKRLANYVSSFKQANGKIYAFIPELEKIQPSMGNIGRDPWQPVKQTGMGSIGAAPKGFWVEASGLSLDESSRSGDTSSANVFAPGESEFTLRMDGGAPLAVFGNNKGYMRLATQQQKSADSLRLGNNSGTVAGSIRQNAQRRTLL